jgi:hypothetical protein
MMHIAKQFLAQVQQVDAAELPDVTTASSLLHEVLYQQAQAVSCRISTTKVRGLGFAAVCLRPVGWRGGNARFGTAAAQ